MKPNEAGRQSYPNCWLELKNPWGSRPEKCHHPKHKKNRPKGRFLNGERGGTRTLGPLIKSQMLYRLSYALEWVYLYIKINIKSRTFLSFFKKNKKNLKIK